MTPHPTTGFTPRFWAQKLLRSGNALPAVMLLVGAVLSVMGGLWRQQQINAVAQADFVRAADRVSVDVQQRFRHSVYPLEGARGLYAASSRVERGAFRDYVASHDLPKKFPGVRGFGFIQRVMRADLDSFIAAERDDGAPQFTVRQLVDKSHDDLYIIKLVEPAAVNVGALGLDVGSEAARRSAILHAIDSGEPTFTGIITLVQAHSTTPGVLLYNPVYARGEYPTSVAQRRANLLGMLYSPIVIAELLDQVTDVTAGLVDFDLFDGPLGATGTALVFNTAQLNAGQSSTMTATAEQRFSLIRPLSLSGRDFTIRVNSTPAFDRQIDRASAWLVLLFGIAVSSLLALLLRQQATQRRRAESLARQMTQDLRLMADVVQLTANSVTTSDPQMRMTWVNEGFTRVSGYAATEALGKTAGELLGSGKADPATLKALSDALVNGTGCQVEILNRARDGHEYWIATDIQPRRDDQGGLIGFMEVGLDITARKMAETELLQHRDHLADLVQMRTADLERTLLALKQQRFVIDEHAIVTVCGVDGRITYGNDKFSQVSGYSREELLGHDHDLLNSGYHPKGFFKAMYQTIARGEVWHGDICNRAKDASLYWVNSTTATFMNGDNEPREYISVSTDITARKQAEEAAQAANRAKSAFLANMSHELRTPMNGVVGMVDILQATTLLPEQHRMLGTIAKSSTALLKILNDILDFSKIEAGMLDVESVPTDLPEVAEGATQLMQSLASASSVELSVFVSPEVPQWVMCDPHRLRQVLLNLLANAVKFSGAQPDRHARVLLRIEPCTLDAGGLGLRFRVIDSGIGMSAEVVAKLFHPFMQADESSERQFGGTGLGLSISQRLVELMGGRITVQSTPGVGSEFGVELPLIPCEPGHAPAQLPRHAQPVAHRERHDPAVHPTAPTVEAAAQAQRLILLAEDNETNRDVMQEQLRLLGHTCEVAEDGAIALQMWQSNPKRYALLLSDCHMPNLDGFGLTAAIRAAEPAGTRLPIIAVTANAMQGEAQRCRERGMDDYLSKPLRMSELRDKLDKWLPAPEPEPGPGYSPVRSESTPVRPGSVPPANESALPIWNPATLTELVGDNPGMHRRLLEKFLLNAQKQLAEITAAAATMDAFDTLAGVAHTLKSAARSVGALRLGELCQQLETSGRAGDAQKCSVLVAELDAAYTSAAASIIDHLVL